MPSSDDYGSSTGTLDSRSSRERHYRRGPPVLDRPRWVEEDRFESRLQETERYGPPSRRPDRDYEDDHLFHDRPRGVSPPRPRLVRRQSSLDTFDRIPSRKLDDFHHRPRAPEPPHPRRRPSTRHREVDYYEDIRIAEPDYYGDEEFRGFRERERRASRPRRSSSRFREREVEEVEIEKPYPRKGKTRMPRRLVHTRAIRELGYPFEEEGDIIMVQLALSKEQIDEVIRLSRDIRRRSERRSEHLVIHTHSPSPVRERRTVERLAVAAYSPRTSYDALIVESPPSRYQSHSRSRQYELSEKRTTTNLTRTRSISVHGPRRLSSPPVYMVGRQSGKIEVDKVDANRMAIVVRPRDSDEDFAYETIRDTEIVRPDGEVEEILEVKKDRKGPNPLILRAMMATLT